MIHKLGAKARDVRRALSLPLSTPTNPRINSRFQRHIHGALAKRKPADFIRSIARVHPYDEAIYPLRLDK